MAGHYPHLQVQVAAARRLEGRGIELRGLSIGAREGRTPSEREWVYVDEMFLTCQADLTELLAGTPRIRQLTLRRMRVHATCYQEGQWNLAKLLPLPKFGGEVPTIVIEDSAVDVKDLCRQPERGMSLREINVKLQADKRAGDARKWRLSGTLLGDHFKRVKVQGLTDPSGAEWSAWGTIDGLEMSQRMLHALPVDAAKYLSFLATLRARAPVRVPLGASAQRARTGGLRVERTLVGGTPGRSALAAAADRSGSRCVLRQSAVRASSRSRRKAAPRRWRCPAAARTS